MKHSGIDTLSLGFWTRLRLGWRLLRDPRVPSWPKLLAPAITLLYVVSPVDVIPDFIPVLGQLDDIGVVAIALAIISMLAQWSPADVVEQHLVNLGSRPMAAARRERTYPAGKEPIEAKYWVDDWK